MTPNTPTTLSLALVYDMNACRAPTGVTRHALAQAHHLSRRPDVRLRLVSGRISEPDGLAFWNSLDTLPRRQLPLNTRWALRFWRFSPWPPTDWWTGPVDWLYAPAEYGLPSRKARVAVTSHDVQQDLLYGGPRRKSRLQQVFQQADLVLSVSQYNTDRLLEAFPFCQDRTAIVPNAADDLFFEPTPDPDRAAIRPLLGLPPGMPYLLSVANFQPRKNLERLLRAAGRLPEVADGSLALVLIGSGDPDQTRALQETASSLGPRALVSFPGYLQGPTLRAAYAEASCLIFPSLCESFGIPAVEAMAQGCPVALSDSSALPEIGGPCAWYFDPENDDAITTVLRSLLDNPTLRADRVTQGLHRAHTFRWHDASQRLVDALRAFPRKPAELPH